MMASTPPSSAPASTGIIFGALPASILSLTSGLTFEVSNSRWSLQPSRRSIIWVRNVLSSRVSAPVSVQSLATNGESVRSRSASG